MYGLCFASGSRRSRKGPLLDQMERFTAVKEKLELGWSKSRGGHELNLSCATIRAYARLEEHAGRLSR